MMLQIRNALFRRVSVMLLITSTLLFSTPLLAEIITDITGHDVAIPKKVERILLGEGRLFHAVALLEGDKPFDRIVGWQGDFRRLDTQNYTIYREKFPEIDNIPLIGNTSADSINAERVLTLRPDLAIFGISGHGPGKGSELVSQLEKSGVPVLFVDFRTSPLANTVPSIRILGKALHREAQAERYIQFYQENVKKVTDIVKTIPINQRPKIFLELKAATGDDCCGTAGDGNMGNFIDLAGGINIAKQLLPGALGTINLEKVIAADPDIYIATGGQTANSKSYGLKMGAQVSENQAIDSGKAVLSRKGISSLRAVKEGNTHGLWHSYYNSPYNVLVIQLFAKWFYPEHFSLLEPMDSMKTLYDDFLAIEPSGVFWVNSLNSN